MTITLSELRAQLGERIPAHGDESDTMFTNAELMDLIAVHGDKAVLAGWRIKAAEFANLVDTTEGTSKRAMSDLHANALKQIAALESGVEVARGTRIRRLGRDGELP